MVDESPSRAASSARTVLRSLTFAALWIPYATLVWRYWFVTDDAFISFRYARNFARGFGLRYNMGVDPPIEGYSNFLWVLIAAGVELLGGYVGFWMPLLSAICGSVLLYWVFHTLIGRFELGLPCAFLGTATLAFFPPFAVWSSGGLATVPFALAIFVMFERLALRREGVDAIAAATAGLCASLLRVEGVAWCVVLACLALLVRRLRGERALKQVALFLVLVALPFGAYYAWRYAYYELPVPNTVYAKGERRLDYIYRGCRYVAIHYLTFLAPLLVLPAYLWSLRRLWWPGVAMAAISTGFVLYSILVGGDFMAMGRFLVPSFAFNAVLFACWLQRVWDGGGGRRLLAAGTALAAVVLGLLPGWNNHLVPYELRAKLHFRHNIKLHLPEYAQWRYMNQNCLMWKARGLALGDYAEPMDTVVLGAVGNTGYYSELFIYDKAGLTSHEVAVNAEESKRLKSPGHDKGVLSAFFLDKKPTYMEVKLFNGPKMLLEIKKETDIWRRPSYRELYRDEYVPNLRVFPEWLGEIPPRVLLVYERREEGTDPDALWDEFDARVEAYDWESIGAVRPEQGEN